MVPIFQTFDILFLILFSSLCFFLRSPIESTPVATKTSDDDDDVTTQENLEEDVPLQVTIQTLSCHIRCSKVSKRPPVKPIKLSYELLDFSGMFTKAQCTQNVIMTEIFFVFRFDQAGSRSAVRMRSRLGTSGT